MMTGRKKRKDPFAGFLIAFTLGTLLSGTFISLYCALDSWNGSMNRIKGYRHGSVASQAAIGFVLGAFPGAVAGAIAGIIVFSRRLDPPPDA
jgi:hypothetical protein